MELTETEKKDLRDILEKIFGFQDATRWNMNEQVLEVVTTMMQEAQKCSAAMNYVPRPSYIINISYLKRELRNIA